ncbi:MAG: N-acetyl-gamma-glutamyl-phosphate reductase [Chitinophagales bacterium]|nr:N-acetyl-gamma-glutamyl-phosphate reductase [Chitinophagales bacterium]
MIKAGIIGAAGYTGGETIRLLLNHPEVTLVFAQSRSQAGKRLSEVHQDLLGETDLRFTQDASEPVEVLFLCLGHGEAKAWLESRPNDPSLRVIDLSTDYRAGGAWSGHDFVYGLPELQRENIRRAHLIANPGCFATALQLALLPLAESGQLGEVYATGITGATGAGQSLSATSHFPWRHANISPYKTLQHQHLKEVQAALHRHSPGAALHFVPWRGDFTRGIYVSCTLKSSLTQAAAQALYSTFYQTHPFTQVSDTTVDLKMVVNTNKCVISLEKQGEHLVVHAAIDNLLKGAAGQAVQNMNLIFGLDETLGLKLKPTGF